MSAELHRVELENFIELLEREGGLGPRYLAGAAHIRGAIRAYDQLSDRLLRDRVTLSLQISNLRARLAEIDPEFK